MASRGKKKNPNAVRVDNSITKQLEVLKKENTKVNKIFNGSLSILLLIIFVFVLFTPISHVYVSLDLSKISGATDATVYECDADVAPFYVMIAPLHGLDTGLKFIANKMGLEFKTNASYNTFYQTVEYFAGADYMHALEVASCIVFVMSVIMFATFIVFACVAIYERSKHKTKYKGVLVLSSIFAIEVLVMFVTVLVMFCKSATGSFSITIGWGMWTLGVLAGCIEGVNLWYAIKYSKINKQEILLNQEAEK